MTCEIMRHRLMSISRNEMLMIEMKVMYSICTTQELHNQEKITTFMLEQILPCVSNSLAFFSHVQLDECMCVSDHSSSQGYVLFIDSIIENVLPCMSKCLVFSIISLV